MIEKNIDKNKNVKQQVVAGFIVYRRTPEGIKFLFENFCNFLYNEIEMKSKFFFDAILVLCSANL